MASTLDIDDEDFLGGQLTFSGEGASKGVRNDGVIAVGRGGYAALLGGTIRNDGLIVAPAGKIGFGAGERATIDLSGDRFLSVALPSEAGVEGDGALIENAGTVSASAGHVVMQAATARHAARHAVNLSGVAEATTVGGRSGAIVLGGGAGGKVTVSGSVRTTAASAKGGDVTVTGRTVALSGASLDASGAEGGGSIRVGGDWQGTGELLRADEVRVDAGTTLAADARRDGNGGEVVLWSDGAMAFGGRISATGAGSGRGGDAEVSGKAVLSYDGIAYLTGPGGFGTLLLDPYNMTITDAEGAGTGLTASGEDSTLSATALEQQLATANVTVATGSDGAQEGDITVAADIDWSADTTLTLDAANDILINADIAGRGEGSGVALSFGGDYAVNGSVTLTGPDAALSVNGDAYTLIQSVEDLEAVKNDSQGDYALVADLDLGGKAYDDGVVGTWYFGGTIAGFGHVISNLNIDAGTGVAGFVPRTQSSATIRDLGLVGGTVAGGTFTGGVVGLHYGKISNVYTDVTVSSSSGRTGGLTGSVESGGTVTDSYALGDVTAVYGVGGAVGYNYGTLSNVHATGNVVATDGSDTGGLVGRNLSSGSIFDSYATGSVESTRTYVGGLVGENEGNIVRAYATGSVEGPGAVGGLVGANRATIDQVYASGQVTSSGARGGLLGINSGGTVTNSFFDTDTTTQPRDVWFETPEGVTDLTTGEARTAEAYAGWDFDNVWYQAGDMRPILRSELTMNASGPTAIENDHQLALIGADLWGSYVLTRDIDLSATDAGTDASGIWSGQGWVPLGGTGPSFSGTIDGGGHDVSGLKIDREETVAAGLVSRSTRGSEIRDLGVVDASVVAGRHTGILIGRSASMLNNVHTSGSVAGSDYVGGLVGESIGTIRQSNSAADVQGSIGVGGLAGRLIAGSAQDVYATGSVEGRFAVGGLVGMVDPIDASVQIERAYATGEVTADGDFGGLVGMIFAPSSEDATTGTTSTVSLSDSFWNTETTGVEEAAVVFYGFSREPETTVFIEGTQGLTTAQLQDTEGFMALAGAAGWDFDGVWMPPSEGHNPELYGTSNVVFLNGISGGVSATYGETEATVTGALAASTGSAGRLLSDTTSGDFTVDVDTTGGVNTVGSYALASDALPSSVVGKGGKTYRVLSRVSGDATVTPRALTVTAKDASKTYGDDPVTLGYSLTEGDLIGSDSLSGSVTSAGNTATADAADYDITQGGVSAGDNYAITFEGGTLTVTPRGITVSATDASKTYGETTDLGYEITEGDLVNEDSLSGALASDGTEATAGVDSYAITQGTLANGNYAITFEGGTLQVTPRGITVAATDASKTYGDTTDLDYEITAGDLVNGDSLSGALASDGTAATAGVESYAITQGTLANGNYAISFEGGTLQVIPRGITVAATDASKTYGETIDLGYEITEGDLVNGDSLSGELASDGTAATAGVESYAITQGDLANGNYAITFEGGTLQVTPRGITVAATDANKTYGETTDLGYEITEGDLVNGDSLSGELASDGTAATAGVDSYAITQGSLANGNYAITFENGTLQVTPRGITVAATDASKTYGETTDLGYEITEGDLVNDDSLSGALASDGTAATAGVDSYAITQGDLANNNYAITFEGGTLTVTPRDITVSATDASKTYGETTELGYVITEGDLVNEDNLSGALASDGTAATAGVESYAITQGSLANGNYVITFDGGTLQVTPRGITVAASDASKTYGETTDLGYEITAGNLVNDDSLSGALASDGTAATAGVESYAITQGDLANNNYAITFEGGTLQVTPRGLTVAATDAIKTYGQTTDLGYEITAGDLVNGDSLSGALASDGTAATAGVDGYAITQGTLDNGNYAITFEGGTLQVTPRGITVAANDAAMTEGGAVPELTFEIVDGELVNGDALAGALATLAGPESQAGAYDITQGTLANRNYDIAFENGTLTIAARPVDPVTPPATPEVTPAPVSGKPAELLARVPETGPTAPGRLAPAVTGDAAFAVAGNGVNLDGYVSGATNGAQQENCEDGTEAACDAN
ncbi:MBG domain-containing protein [Salipiger sp.]|uniref:MBG domain-containing protein n=1 Tax=Salipiger sp. TaxID=2078585 RepID=UPI003A97BC7D